MGDLIQIFGKFFIGFIVEGFAKGEGLGYGVICRVGNFDIEIELEYFWMTVFSN